MGQQLVYESEDQHALIDKLDRIAANDAEVMILGPSGVGKELYAEYLHAHSPRRNKAFVTVNCANLSVESLENEMFGHAKGAFTGAHATTDGIVAAAEGGTLFLDEVDSLGLLCQAKLLRFIQLKEYRRLGETFTRKVDLRLIASSNADLRAMVAQGTFREDLFFRLHVLPVTITPLRERSEDLDALIRHFTRRYASEYGLDEMRLSARARSAMERHDWPGNVRELENVIRYLTCLDLGRDAEPEDFPFDLSPAHVPEKTAAVLEPASTTPEPLMPLEASPEPLAVDVEQPLPGDSLVTELPLREAKSRVVESFERAYVEDALHRTEGNVAKAARDSGKHRRAFFELMRRYGIDANLFRRK